MNYILDIDGGATKIVFKIEYLSEKVVAESEYGSSNFKIVDIEVSKV